MGSAWKNRVVRAAFVLAIVGAVCGKARAADWRPYVPKAQQVLITVGKVHSEWSGRVQIICPDPGYRATWANITRQGNVFIANVSVERWSGGASPLITTLSNAYNLGAPKSGTYRLRVVSRNQVIKELVFVVRKNT